MAGGIKIPAMAPVGSYPIVNTAADMASAAVESPVRAANRDATIARDKAAVAEAPLGVQERKAKLGQEAARSERETLAGDDQMLARLSPLLRQPNAAEVINAPNVRKLLDPILQRRGAAQEGPLDPTALDAMLNPKKRLQDMTGEDVAKILATSKGEAREAALTRFDLPPEALEHFRNATMTATAGERIDARRRIESEWHNTVTADQTPDQLANWVQFHRGEMKDLAGMSDADIDTMVNNPAVLNQTGKVVQAKLDRYKQLGLIAEADYKKAEAALANSKSLIDYRKIQGQFLGFKEGIMSQELAIKAANASTAATNAQTGLTRLQLQAGEYNLHGAEFRSRLIRDNVDLVKRTEDDARKDLKDLQGQAALYTLRKEVVPAELQASIKAAQDTIVSAKDTFKKLLAPQTPQQKAERAGIVIGNPTQAVDKHGKPLPAAPKDPDHAGVHVYPASPGVPQKGTVNKDGFQRYQQEHKVDAAQAIQDFNKAGYAVDLSK